MTPEKTRRTGWKPAPFCFKFMKKEVDASQWRKGHPKKTRHQEAQTDPFPKFPIVVLLL